MVDQIVWKLTVYKRMDLVTDMDADAKRAMNPNTLGMAFIFFFHSWIIFIHINTEMRRFVYSVIGR